MTELVCVAFDDPKTADRALADVERLEKEYLIDVADAAVAVRRPDGRVKVRQTVNLVGTGAAGGGTWGALWGTLIGLLFLNPLAGLLTGGVLGAGAGALSGALSDYGIDDDFIKRLGETITPDSSALFLLIRDAKPDRVLEEMQGYKGTILRTSLSREQEEKLARFLADSKADMDAEARAA
ncbi:DUF1269 domain-containing protein [Roseospira goensis]|uniref:Putative membrane protein n=1 Tax=Roseospira goensis TaxID=391922 RepID=A0A7W6WLP9_9PROT|nr:DUF1269 domain-containing protein [Roseospira goensis]MBB4286637.1 putative membrane protein [Roseospira goensis]